MASKPVAKTMASAAISSLPPFPFPDSPFPVSPPPIATPL